MSQYTRKENKKYGADRLHRILVSLHRQFEIENDLKMFLSRIIVREVCPTSTSWARSQIVLMEERLIV